MGIEKTRPAAVEAGQTLQAAQLGAPPARYSLGVHQKICENIKAGNRPVTAAQMAGIPSHIFYRWMNAGKNGDPHLYQFAEDVEIAIGEFEGKMTQKVVEDADVDAKSAQWVLERRFPEGYSKEVDAKVQAQQAAFLKHLEEHLSPAEFFKVLAITSGFTGNEVSQLNAKPELEEPQEGADST